MTLVVALLAAVAATSAFAREFRAADTQNEDYPTVQALLYMGSMVAERSGGRAGYNTLTEHTMSSEVQVRIVTDIDRKPFEAAMAGLYAKAQRDPTVAQLIERIRKVE